MSVSLPDPGWCPETSDALHSGAWYDGGMCDACGQDGPDPDDYLWPAGRGERWDVL